MFEHLEGWYDVEADRDYLTGVTMADVGDVLIQGSDTKGNYARITGAAASIARRGALLAAIGGDHSISYPLGLGMEPLGAFDVVHVDAGFGADARGRALPGIGPRGAQALRARAAGRAPGQRDRGRERRGPPAAAAELLGSIGEGSDIVPPVQVDYGFNVHIGARVFVNFGAFFIDTREITIGDEVLVGPAVQFLSADHPLDAGERRAGWESGRPIAIGAGAWLGGGVIVLGGVTIGENAVIGAGSVVTRDVPPGVVAVGSPARVIRTL